jgi:hypothetical protein
MILPLPVTGLANTSGRSGAYPHQAWALTEDRKGHKDDGKSRATACSTTRPRYADVVWAWEDREDL